MPNPTEERKEQEIEQDPQFHKDYKPLRAQIDGRIAPDTLIQQVTNDLTIGLKTKNSQYNLIDNQMSQLNNILLFLRNIFELRCVEVIYGGILMNKIWNKNKNLITMQNVPQLVVGSLLIAHKYTGDYTYKNKTWAQALRIDIKTLNQWEIDVLEAVNYQIFVEGEQYDQIENIFRDRCDQQVAMESGCVTN
ncbi:MAG: hypothetical protein EZS28_002914 [Streblomastix strix]|uniref:Cyclin N-terminal domain-containing protein n=1 Tax=Streblomastix strix TaxID=222440 RepID=A0A5J4X2Y0_9EUKA|nr:MAG: hypothetical protein EZS28_002914 [Streblomastix strix]